MDNFGNRMYLRARQRLRLYDLVLRHYQASGMTPEVLAKGLRLTVTKTKRILRDPSLWTLDVVSDLLFVISNHELTMESHYLEWHTQPKQTAGE